MNITPRQQEIYALLAMGMCDKQIMTKLGICRGTVCAHKNELFKRLGVRTRVQAALKWHGLR